MILAFLRFVKTLLHCDSYFQFKRSIKPGQVYGNRSQGGLRFRITAKKILPGLMGFFFLPKIFSRRQSRFQLLTCWLTGSSRMIIENSMENGIDFFRMDALPLVAAIKGKIVTLLTLIASSLYCLPGQREGVGYAKSFQGICGENLS